MQAKHKNKSGKEAQQFASGFAKTTKASKNEKSYEFKARKY